MRYCFLSCGFKSLQTVIKGKMHSLPQNSFRGSRDGNKHIISNYLINYRQGRLGEENGRQARRAISSRLRILDHGGCAAAPTNRLHLAKHVRHDVRCCISYFASKCLERDAKLFSLKIPSQRAGDSSVSLRTFICQKVHC